jgi:predicted glycoside hydrolase/deacetylase ChbG (UPF0249 family)
MPTQPRQLLVIADDFGIGPETTAGILQLAASGLVTGSAMLVSAPDAANSVAKWRQLGSTLELGWHPNLTLDSPLALPAQVPSLVRDDGTFWPLGAFMKRWLLGKLDPQDIRLELHLQLRRFIDLVGRPPTFVNCHHHVGVFAPVGQILLQTLGALSVKPYIRRVQEPWRMLWTLPGARLKRTLLGYLGRRLSRMQQALGFPGNDSLAGITSPRCMEEPDCFVRWLRVMPGQTVELMCHPGQLDRTLFGRDGTESDGLVQQRVNELHWLREPAFMEAVREAGFRLTAPAELVGGNTGLARSA